MKNSRSAIVPSTIEHELQKHAVLQYCSNQPKGKRLQRSKAGMNPAWVANLAAREAGGSEIGVVEGLRAGALSVAAEKDLAADLSSGTEAMPAELVGSLSATIRPLRRDFPNVCYNCVIQTQEFTAIARAHFAHPMFSEELRRI